MHTYFPPAEERARWWEFFRKKLREGRQGYVIAPLVEGSEQVQAASLNETYETLANGELEAFRLGLIHGRMTPAEKDAAMDAFRRGETQVLVATSVVEVGVDVPNATLMTIEGAERFGLAQLHQLRGRISRGTFPGYCCVFADPQTDEAVAAAQGLRRLDRRLSAGRDRFRPPRARRPVRHPAARPAAAAHRRPGARRRRARRSPPRRPGAGRRRPGPGPARARGRCGAWRWCATASRSTWATWVKAACGSRAVACLGRGADVL